MVCKGLHRYITSLVFHLRHFVFPFINVLIYPYSVLLQGTLLAVKPKHKEEIAFKSLPFVRVGNCTCYIVLAHPLTNSNNNFRCSLTTFRAICRCSVLCNRFHFHTFCFGHWWDVSVICLLEHCHFVH